jgi:hypothetical protein
LALVTAGLKAAPAFVAHGVYPGTSDADLPRGIPTMGSWVNGDSFEGSYTSPWFPTRSAVVIFVAGYPHGPGMSLSAQWRDAAGSVTTVPYDGLDPKEGWMPWRIAPPPGAVEVRWTGVDHSRLAGGWLGASDPCPGRWSPAYLPVAAQGISVFLGMGLALLLALSGVLGWTRRWLAAGLPSGSTPTGLSALLGGAVLALAGYCVFWISFFSAPAGALAGWMLLGAAIAAGLATIARGRKAPEALAPWLLAAAVGSAYVGLLFAFPARSWAAAAANRFLAGMPSDNRIPGDLASRLVAGVPLKPFLPGWQSSDRPPLQIGWILLFRPLLSSLGFNLSVISGAAGTWFQLFWVPAIWAMAESMGCPKWRSAAVAVSASPFGYMLFNSVYVWPKLAAGALAVGAGAILLRRTDTQRGRPSSPRLTIAAGLLLGLGLLSHGGAAFAVLAILLLMLFSRGRGMDAVVVLGAILAVTLPWAAYQHFYDPPGNRLLKWHLAGYLAIDDRGFLETLVSQYRSLGWRNALSIRRDNLVLQGWGDWLSMPRFISSQRERRLESEFFLRACGWLLPSGILAWGWIALRRRRDPALDLRVTGRWAAWLVFTWTIWLALMFVPDSPTAHQGSSVIGLVLYGLLLAGLFTAWPRLAWAIIVLQAVYFAMTWLPAAPGYLLSPDGP